MIKSTVFSTIFLASLATFAAKETTEKLVKEDFKLSLNELTMKANGRNTREVFSAGKSTHCSVYGAAKVVEGKSGSAMNVTDGRGRVEMRLTAGDYYNASVATVGFWIKVPEKGLSTQGSEATILEERGGKIGLRLFADAKGKIHLSGSANFISAAPTVEEIKTRMMGNISNDFAAVEKKLRVQKGWGGVPGDELSEGQLAEVNKVLLAQYDKASKEEAANAGDKVFTKPKSFEFDADPFANVNKFKKGAWTHLALSWDAYKGIYSLYVNGALAMRAVQSDVINGDRTLGSGPVLVFGAGKSKMETIVDDVTIKAYHYDRRELDVQKEFN